MSGVLVDTLVWIEHFRHRSRALTALLETDQVLMHPMVYGELACGTPPEPRAQTLQDLKTLRQTQQASLPEVLEFIDREKLYGLGCGLVDLVLLASTLITPEAQLWTLDKRLAAISERFGVAHHSVRH